MKIEDEFEMGEVEELDHRDDRSRLICVEHVENAQKIKGIQEKTDYVNDEIVNFEEGKTASKNELWGTIEADTNVSSSPSPLTNKSDEDEGYLESEPDLNIILGSNESSKKALRENDTSEKDSNNALKAECSENGSDEEVVEIKTEELIETKPVVFPHGVFKKDPHMCPTCGKLFAKKGYLRKHILTHSYKKDHKCTNCDKSFYTKGNLKKHVQVHSGVNYECATCGKSFSRRRGLKTHEVVHSISHEKKIHMCSYCGKSFAAERYLKSHELVHAPIKDHKCLICEKSFTSRSILRIHELTHSEVRAHACCSCGKSFKQSAHLKTHMKSHEDNNNRKFVCKCGSSFRNPNHLKRHENLHLIKSQMKVKNMTGEKPYSCDICEKSFKKNGNLKRHIDTELHTSNLCFVDTIEDQVDGKDSDSNIGTGEDFNPLNIQESVSTKKE